MMMGSLLSYRFFWGCYSMVDVVFWVSQRADWCVRCVVVVTLRDFNRGSMLEGEFGGVSVKVCVVFFQGVLVLRFIPYTAPRTLIISCAGPHSPPDTKKEDTMQTLKEDPKTQRRPSQHLNQRYTPPLLPTTRQKAIIPRPTHQENPHYTSPTSFPSERRQIRVLGPMLRPTPQRHIDIQAGILQIVKLGR